MSTAYSQCILRKIPESVPKLPISYKDVLKTIESQSEEESEQHKDKLVKYYNCYILVYPIVYPRFKL